TAWPGACDARAPRTGDDEDGEGDEEEPMSEDERYVVGVDFGTLSGRAVLVRVADGAEVADAVHEYDHGVIDETLPAGGRLDPDWALQAPGDWLDVLRVAVPKALAAADVPPSRVIGIGTDFTACTVLPATADGTPLSDLYPDRPHAWPKLWKHHAGQPQADRINALAAERGEPWLRRYGGKISSEWEFAKGLQLLEQDPELYRLADRWIEAADWIIWRLPGREARNIRTAGSQGLYQGGRYPPRARLADRWIEAADWIIWRLTGRESRNICTAGYKGIYQDGRYPSREFLAALHPDFADFTAKLGHDLSPLGGLAGTLTAEAAAWTGLPEGIAVAVGNVDAHVTAAAADAVRPGQMVAIMGTSTCHVMSSDRLAEVPGMCGVVADGIVPGLWGYEAGQSGVGDIFAW